MSAWCYRAWSTPTRAFPSPTGGRRRGRWGLASSAVSIAENAWRQRSDEFSARPLSGWAVQVPLLAGDPGTQRADGDSLARNLARQPERRCRAGLVGNDVEREVVSSDLQLAALDDLVAD